MDRISLFSKLRRRIRSGNIPSYADLDGVDDYVTTASHADITNVFYNSAGIIGAWIKPTAGGSDRAVISKCPASFAVGWKLYINDATPNVNTRIYFQYAWSSANGTWNSTTLINFDTWNRIWVSYDTNSEDVDADPVFYVNGVSTVTNELGTPSPASTADPDTGSNDLYIGSTAGTQDDFFGGIADVVIYKGTLTAQNILDDYNLGLAALADGTFEARYKLNASPNTNSGNGGSGNATFSGTLITTDVNLPF
jgi:hypothetical protein